MNVRIEVGVFRHLGQCFPADERDQALREGAFRLIRETGVKEFGNRKGKYPVAQKLQAFIAPAAGFVSEARVLQCAGCQRDVVEAVPGQCRQRISIVLRMRRWRRRLVTAHAVSRWN